MIMKSEDAPELWAIVGLVAAEQNRIRIEFRRGKEPGVLFTADMTPEKARDLMEMLGLQIINTDQIKEAIAWAHGFAANAEEFLKRLALEEKPTH